MGPRYSQTALAIVTKAEEPMDGVVIAGFFDNSSPDLNQVGAGFGFIEKTVFRDVVIGGSAQARGLISEANSGAPARVAGAISDAPRIDQAQIRGLVD